MLVSVILSRLTRTRHDMEETAVTLDCRRFVLNWDRLSSLSSFPADRLLSLARCCLSLSRNARALGEASAEPVSRRQAKRAEALSPAEG
jgi:hypothetical protein